ncbi:hypothetical protein [Undibacterium danionis]|uniref:Uncharacterized protein n=1 Tax=Undibacterium danionis TaxID=1812100 RepID=A0ABV6IEI3_9BURK
MKVKFGIALICVLLGLVVAGFQAFQGHWLSAISALILGPTVGLIFLLGIDESQNSLLIQSLAGLAGVLGLFAVFFEHRAFDIRRTEAHASALTAFVQMEFSCPVMDASIRNIQQKGIRACALQDNHDQIGAITELQKARALGPVTSLVDSAYSVSKPSNADFCAEEFRAAQLRCPRAFLSMTNSSRELLLKSD